MDDKEQTFLKVVETGSFRAAAELLNTDPSSVSRKIAALEARLGVRLLQRSTRRSAPTDVGAEYYDGLSRLMSEQAALEARISGETDTPTGLLRVTAPVDFGARFVTPVLQGMQTEHPALLVDLTLGSGFFDLPSQGIDVAIRIGTLPDSSLIARKLGTVPRVMVASQAYLDRMGTPESIVDLKNHNFILYGRNPRPIEITTPDGRKTNFEVSGRFSVNSVTSICSLARAGQGIHVGPMWAHREDLAAGNLVALLPNHSLGPFPIHALYRATAYVPAKIRQFIDRMTLNAAW